MTPEPLHPLADAVSHEVTRLIGEFQRRYGMDLDLVVSIDQDAGTVTVRGDSLAAWGPRQSLQARLDRAGLQCQVRMPGGAVIVYPSTT